MIKYECNKGVTIVEVAGNLAEIASDVFLLCHIIYDNLEDVRKKFFKSVITENIKAAFFDEGELDELNNELTKEEASYETARAALDEIAESISEEEYNVLATLLEVIHASETRNDNGKNQ